MGMQKGIPNVCNLSAVELARLYGVKVKEAEYGHLGASEWYFWAINETILDNVVLKY